jgi:hypothetical protein
MVDAITIEKLRMIFPEGNEGALFNNDSNGIAMQTAFIEKIIRAVQPKRVVEIGTNKGYFDYYLLTLDSSILIDTFDIAPVFEKAVEIINGIFGNRVTFHCGNSIETFAIFNPPYRIDLAYVDWGHDFPVAKQDMLNCERLGIPHILIDDRVQGEPVARAAQEMMEDFGWRFTDQTDFSDGRALTYYRRAA